jgi:hypothetical protein
MRKETGSRKKEVARWFGGWVCVALLCGVAGGQEIRLGDGRPVAGKGHVVLVSDAVDVEGGKESVVELRFRVEQGFHINSHAPKDELLIPTVLKLDAGVVKVGAEEYAPGTAFRLEVGAGETLDVYQGEFRVTVRMVAPKGASTLTGSLRYQACDRAACFPPRTLPVMVAVTGK